jgi:hypothetical protein
MKKACDDTVDSVTRLQPPAVAATIFIHNGAPQALLGFYETVGRWCKKFGETFANRLRCRRPRPEDKWHMDEGAPRTH